MAEDGVLTSRERVFKALSDRTRLEIIEYLRGGEKCVCEIIPALGKAQSTTSKNLDILYEAGVLERRQDGKKTLYSIKSGEIFQLLRGADAISLKHLAPIEKAVRALEKSLE